MDSFKNQLEIMGHTVSIITLDFLGTGNDKSEQNVFRIKCPIRFIYKNNHMALPISAYRQMQVLMKEISPDIIHSQHPFLLGVTALKTGNKLRIPVIFTYHTQYEKYLHYIPFPEFFTKPVINKLITSYCNRVSGIIVPSLSIFQILKANANISNNIDIIPSSINPIFLSEKLKLRNQSEPFSLITVSRFAKEKNIEFLLDMYSMLDPERFTLTLIGYGAHLTYLKSYAFDNLRLSRDKVFFIEKPDKKTISNFYATANAFIFASQSETQGLVLAEAMASGLPVIAFNAAGSCDIIKNNINGFLIDSHEDMIQKINLLKNNSDLYINMQTEAWNTGLEYCPSLLTHKLVNFYNSQIK